MMRIVIDTDVVISALRSATGASAELIDLVFAKRVIQLINVPLAFEYEAQCARHAREVNIPIDDAIVFADAIISCSERVQNYFLWRPQLRDANDEMVLEAAINGRADAIVSFNHKDFGDIPASFGIELLKPIDVIRRF